MSRRQDGNIRVELLTEDQIEKVRLEEGMDNIDGSWACSVKGHLVPDHNCRHRRLDMRACRPSVADEIRSLYGTNATVHHF